MTACGLDRIRTGLKAGEKATGTSGKSPLPGIDQNRANVGQDRRVVAVGDAALRLNEPNRGICARR